MMAGKNSRNKTWSRLFIILLIIQAVLEFVVGSMILFNLPLALEIGFGITYSSDLEILGVALGLYLMLLTALLILSALWTFRGNNDGTVIGIIVGIFLLVFGVSVYLKFGDINGILVDSLRGIITIFLAYKIRPRLS